MSAEANATTDLPLLLSNMAFPAFDFISMYVSIFHSLPMSPFMNMPINNMEQDWTVALIAWTVKQFTNTIYVINGRRGQNTS